MLPAIEAMAMGNVLPYYNYRSNHAQTSEAKVEYPIHECLLLYTDLLCIVQRE